MKNDDNQSYREERRNENNLGRILTGLVVLAVLVGVGKYLIDRSNENIAGAPGTGNVFGFPTPTLELIQNSQTVTVAMSAANLTKWINQMITNDSITGISTSIQGGRIDVSGQSTSNIVPGAFTAEIYPATNNQDIVEVRRVTREGNEVAAATLSVVNRAVNMALDSYLQDRNLSIGFPSLCSGQSTENSWLQPRVEHFNSSLIV